MIQSEISRQLLDGLLLKCTYLLTHSRFPENTGFGYPLFFRLVPQQVKVVTYSEKQLDIRKTQFTTLKSLGILQTPPGIYII